MSEFGIWTIERFFLQKLSAGRVFYILLNWNMKEYLVTAVVGHIV